MSCREGAGNRALRTTELTLQSHFVLAFDELQGSGEFVCSLFISSDSYFRPHASSFHIQEYLVKASCLGFLLEYIQTDYTFVLLGTQWLPSVPHPRVCWSLIGLV